MNANNVYNTYSKLPLLQRNILIAFFIALTAIAAKISFPFPFTPVPVTLQTLVVFLCGLLLGPTNAFFALLIYLAIGAVGVPVFSKGGGIAYLLGPTGGFLISFPMAAAICGYIYKKSNYRVWGGILGSLVALLFIYLLGTIQLAIVMKKGFLVSLTLAVIPFIPADLIKAAVAVVVAQSIKRRFLS